MSFQIIWSAFAEEQLDGIFDYYCTNVSFEIARNLLISLVESTQILVKHPHIGQEEELLKGREESYRYLVHGNYKIIYSVDAEHRWVKIADIFDTRQNPVKMKRTR